MSSAPRFVVWRRIAVLNFIPVEVLWLSLRVKTRLNIIA